MKTVNPLTLLALIAILTILTVMPSLERAWADEVIATIPVGVNPLYMTYNPANENMYVANQWSDTVSVIDSSNNTVIKTISVGNDPVRIVYNPSNENMYVTNTNSKEVSVIDSSTNSVIDTIRVGNSPHAIEYNPANENIYVANYNSDTVSVIDSSTNSVIDTIDVGDWPISLAYNPANENMYVANLDSDTVSVIDSSNNTVIDTINVNDGPNTIEYNPANENIYVANQWSDTVSVIDSSNNKIRDIPGVGGAPYVIHPFGFNPANNNMYVANYNSDTVSVIDSSTNSVIDTIDVETNPISLEYNPSNENIYVANVNSPSISIISSITNSVIDTIEVDPHPTYLEFNPVNNYVYAVLLTNNEVSAIGPSRAVESPIANAGPDQTVESGVTVQLDGSKSSDSRNGTLTYQWTQTAGPEISLSDSTVVNPTFTAPNTGTQENLVFELVVTNEQDIESQPMNVTITVNPVDPPTADAGTDLTVNSNDMVQLDGSNSSDPNSSRLSYSWNQTSGLEVALSDSSTSNPTFKAPEVNDPTDLTFQLTVTNEEGVTSDPDGVTVIINPVSQPPTEEPRTIGDLLKGIIQNPLDLANSIDSANQIRDILTDSNRDNDQLVCDLIVSGDEHTSNIRELLNC